MTPKILNAALLAALLAAAPAFALESDRSRPIEIEADQGSLDQANQVTTFSGNVVIKQSRGSINGERVVYNLKSGQLQSGGEGGGRVKMRILPKDTAASSAQSSAKGNP